MTKNEAVQEMAGRCLVAWTLHNARMLEIASRPYGIYGGQVQGITLYYSPPSTGPFPPVVAIQEVTS